MTGPVPYLRPLILVPAALAHVFGLVELLTSWPQYRWPWAAALLFAVSLAIPLLLALAPRDAAGSLGTPAAVAVAGSTLLVSVLVPAILPPSSWAGPAAWNWGTGAMTLLGLGVHLRPSRTVLLALAHGVLAAGFALAGGHGGWGAHVVVVAAVVPPLGAAQYMALYAEVVRARAAAMTARAQAEAGRESLDVVRLSGIQRLAALAGRITPLLEDVAEGAALPLTRERAEEARDLARQVREALVAQRLALWLPEEVGGAPVTVVATDAATHAAADADRAWLAALLDMLGTHRGWHQLRVVLDLSREGELSAVLAADGSAARDAAADARVQALCASRSARCEAEGELLVVEADLLTKIGASW